VIAVRKCILITLSLAFVACSGRLKKSEGDADPAISDNFAELQSSAPIYVSSLISAFGTTGNYTGSGFLAFYSGSRYLSGVVKEVAAHPFRSWRLSEPIANLMDRLLLRRRKQPVVRG
jgi:hypothetical protein